MNFSTRARFARVKIIGSLSVVLAIVFSFSVSAVQAVSTAGAITITDISVTTTPATSLSPAGHQVTVSGTYTNAGTTVITPTIQLVTGSALTSRSAVMSAITNNSFAGLTVQAKVSTRVINVLPQQAAQWKLTFNGDEYFTADAPVAVFGAQVAGSADRVVLPHSWFYKNDFKPTQVLIDVPLTTSSFHAVGQGIDSAVGANEIERIDNLLNSLPKQANVIVDPYLRDWLRDFSGTDLSGKAAQLNERLNSFSQYSTVYAQTDIFTAVSNKLTGITHAALSTEDQSISVYSPTADVVSKSVFNAVADTKDTLMIIPNEALGGAQQTIAAHGVSNGTHFLISDSGLAECLTLSDVALGNACLTSLLATITAESPNKARTISVSVPLDASNVSSLQVLNQPEVHNGTFALTDINSVFASDAVTHSIPQGPAIKQQLPTSMRKGLSQLQNLSQSVAAVFDDAQLSRQLMATRYFALSTFSNDQTTNYDRVNNAVNYATDQLHTLSLQGSSRITIPGTKSQLPITIVNGSEHTATVGIQISSSLPGRISAAKIDVVTVEPGKRMTVQIPITVSGAGLISVEASLMSRDNDSFGTPLPIKIASSAYQDIARTLVWTALALLVILLANSLRKRRQSA